MTTFEARSRRTVRRRGVLIAVSLPGRQAARGVGTARVEFRGESCRTACREAR
jgi:hypothetical protein